MDYNFTEVSLHRNSGAYVNFEFFIPFCADYMNAEVIKQAVVEVLTLKADDVSVIECAAYNKRIRCKGWIQTIEQKREDLMQDLRCAISRKTLSSKLKELFTDSDIDDDDDNDNDNDNDNDDDIDTKTPNTEYPKITITGLLLKYTNAENINSGFIDTDKVLETAERMSLIASRINTENKKRLLQDVTETAESKSEENEESDKECDPVVMIEKKDSSPMGDKDIADKIEHEKRRAEMAIMEVRKIKNELEKVTQENRRLNNELDENKKLLDLKEVENRELRTDKLLFSQECVEWKSKYEGMIKERNAIELEADRFARKLKESKNEIENMNTQIKSLQGQLNLKIDEINQIHQRITELTSNLQTVNASNNQLRVRHNDLKMLISELKESSIHKSNAIGALNKSLTSVLNELQIVKKHAQALEQREQWFKLQIVQSANEQQRLIQELQKTKTEIQHLTQTKLNFVRTTQDEIYRLTSILNQLLTLDSTREITQKCIRETDRIQNAHSK